MEPITHFMTGACLGRSGFNRKTAYATAVAVFAAEAADLDILWAFAGPVDELKHHRGITHTLIGAPFVAGAVVACFALWHWIRMKWRTPRPEAVRHDELSVRWGWLYLTALVAALSHILLDWTNNYGVRPFFPFNPHWYAGSILFIAEPVWWALLLMALIMPAILGLADREMGVRRKRFRGRGWALFALVGMLAFGCWRWAEHASAEVLLQQTAVTSAPMVRMALEPYPVNPWRWHAILETPGYYQTAEVNTRTDFIDSDPRRDVLYKPTETAAVKAAKQTFLGKVYLDWGGWAVVRDLGQEPVPGTEPPNVALHRPWTTVEFTDLRFAYAFRGSGSTAPPSTLSGWVYIVDEQEEAGEYMGGREQK